MFFFFERGVRLCFGVKAAWTIRPSLVVKLGLHFHRLDHHFRSHPSLFASLAVQLHDSTAAEMHGAFEIHVFNQRAIDRTLATSPDDAHLKASKYMESGGFTRHGMFTAIIVCRVLPTPHGKTELDGVKASLLQQQRFLEAMIPPHVLTL